jgi:pimeloyl-ACP methyl ester carboxylesterase
VLVLHGGPGASHDYLLPQLLRLQGPAGAEHRELVLYDQRGGGRSRHDDDREAVTWESQVADLGRVIAELGLGTRPTIVGYSWGGLLALLYCTEAAAGRAGPLPGKLVLIDPAPVTRQYREEFESEFARRQGGAEVQALRAELAESGLREQDPEAYRQRTFELSVAGYFADPRNARDLTPFRVTGRVQQSTWQSLGDFDLVPQLRTLRGRFPSLVLHGRQDPIPLASSQACAEAIGATRVVLEHSGHVPYVEQGEALFRAIEDFL